MSGTVVFGSERIPAVTHVEIGARSPEPSAGKVDTRGQSRVKFTTFDQGMGLRRGFVDTEDIQRYRTNQGLWAQIFSGLFLPPVATSQTISSYNTSGFRDLNKRIHQVNSTLGQTKPRSYYFVGTKMFRTTSDTNPALADSTLSLTDTVTAACEVVMNNTRGILVATDGATDDVQLITDPTATPPTKSTALALAVGDRIDAIYYMPTLGQGFVIVHGKVNGTVGWWYIETSEALLTSLKPLMLTVTRDTENADNPSITTAAQFPGHASTIPGADNVRWANIQNILADDGSYAASADIVIDATTDPIMALGFWRDAPFPEASIIVGSQFSAQHKTDSGAGVYLTGEGDPPSGAYLVRAGSMTEHRRTVSDDISSTDEVDTFGGSTDGWDGLRPSDVNDPGYGLALLYWNTTGGGTKQMNLDYVTNTITYKLPGVQAKCPLGGWGVAVDELRASFCYLAAPEFQDEATGVNVPRILWRAELEYTPDGNRPTITLIKVPATLGNVTAACTAQAGVIAAGNPSTGIAKAVKRIELDSGLFEPFDLGFGTGQGYTENWGVTNVHGADNIVVADMALEDATVAQSWINYDGRWHPFGPRETITAMPLAYAEAVYCDPTQRYRYRFTPSGSNTIVTRQYQAINLLHDPLVSNTTQVKHDGVLTLTTPELNAMGDEEDLNVLTHAWFLGREISSSNSVRLRYSIDGGVTFTSWTTFTAAFTKATLNPPVLHRTVIFEIGLDHSAGTSGSPNGLYILVEGTSTRRKRVQYRIFINPAETVFTTKYPNGWPAMVAALQAQEVANGPVSTLKPGNLQSVSAVWASAVSAFAAQPDPTTQRGSVQNPQEGTHYIDFEETV